MWQDAKESRKGRKIWGNPEFPYLIFKVSSNPAAAANEYHDHMVSFNLNEVLGKALYRKTISL